MSPTSTGRRKGGQPGNTNRLKHGLYSPRIANALVDPDGSIRIALIRRRLLALVRKQDGASLRDLLSLERGIAHYVSLILALSREMALPPLPDPDVLQDAAGLPFAALLRSLDLSVDVPPALPQPGPARIRTSRGNRQIARHLPVDHGIRTDFVFSTKEPLPPQPKERR